MIAAIWMLAQYSVFIITLILIPILYCIEKFNFEIHWSLIAVSLISYDILMDMAWFMIWCKCIPVLRKGMPFTSFVRVKLLLYWTFCAMVSSSVISIVLYSAKDLSDIIKIGIAIAGLMVSFTIGQIIERRPLAHKLIFKPRPILV